MSRLVILLNTFVPLHCTNLHENMNSGERTSNWSFATRPVIEKDIYSSIRCIFKNTQHRKQAHKITKWICKRKTYPRPEHVRRMLHSLGIDVTSFPRIDWLIDDVRIKHYYLHHEVHLRRTKSKPVNMMQHNAVGSSIFPVEI